MIDDYYHHIFLVRQHYQPLSHSYFPCDLHNQQNLTTSFSTETIPWIDPCRPNHGPTLPRREQMSVVSRPVPVR